MLWLEQAENLPVGHKARVNCDECGNSNNSVTINHHFDKFTYYCYACGHTEIRSKGKLTLAELTRLKELNEQASTFRDTEIVLPSDFTTDIPLVGRLWLYSGGISPSTWKRYGIGYSNSLKRVVMPVYNSDGRLIWYQCRAVEKGQSPKYIQPSADKSKVVFKGKNDDKSYRTVVVVEDIMSAIRVSKFINCTSILGTKLSTWHINFLSKYSRVITWLDSDRAGQTGAYQVRKSLSLVTEVGNIVTELDPKKLTDEQIRNELCKIVIK